jgi:integrase
MTMASVDKDVSRAKTPWVVRWRDEAGTQRKKGFARKLDADRFRAEVEHRLNTGSYIDPALARTTFQKFAEQWREAQPHRANTATRVLSQLTKHAYPVLGGRPIGQLRTSELQAFVVGLPLAASSARSVFGTVKAVLKAAVQDRMISSNPAAGVKLPELPRKQIVPLTLEQVEGLAATMSLRYRALVMVAAGTGLRQGELFGLQVGDVDFLRRTLTVERQVQSVRGGGGEIGPLKNRHSYRSIPLGRSVVDVLAAHLAEFPAAGADHVFTTPDGGPLHRNAFNKAAWCPARKSAGLPDAGMHDLRHFYASLLIRGGLSVKVVADRLGHANAAMTLNVYSHLWPDDEDRSREAVDAVLRGDVPTMRLAAGG